MIISGPEYYRNSIDFGKLVAFLRKNGYPEEAIQTLHIHFIEHIPGSFLFFFMGKALGHFALTKHYPLLEFSWKEFDRIPKEQDRINTLNTVLLHECLHLIDTSTAKKRLSLHFQTVLAVCCTLSLNILLFFLLRPLPYPWTGITLFLAEIMTFIFIAKIFYFLSLSERAARKKERFDAWVLSFPQPLDEPTEPELAVLPDLPTRKLKSVQITEKLPENLNENFQQ